MPNPVTLARNLLDSIADADETETIEAPASVLLALASAVDRLDKLADRLDDEVDLIGVYGGGGTLTAAHSDAIRAALKGEPRE